MVHIFCQNNNCRCIIHLDDTTHWNYKGKVKCKKCGAAMDVEVQNGKVIYAKIAK